MWSLAKSSVLLLFSVVIKNFPWCQTTGHEIKTVAITASQQTTCTTTAPAQHPLLLITSSQQPWYVNSLAQDPPINPFDQQLNPIQGNLQWLRSTGVLLAIPLILAICVEFKGCRLCWSIRNTPGGAKTKERGTTIRTGWASGNGVILEVWNSTLPTVAITKFKGCPWSQRRLCERVYWVYYWFIRQEPHGLSITRAHMHVCR